MWGGEGGEVPVSRDLWECFGVRQQTSCLGVTTIEGFFRKLAHALNSGYVTMASFPV